jgi:hypothetical protein
MSLPATLGTFFQLVVFPFRRVTGDSLIDLSLGILEKFLNLRLHDSPTTVAAAKRGGVFDSDKPICQFYTRKDLWTLKIIISLAMILAIAFVWVVRSPSTADFTMIDRRKSERQLPSSLGLVFNLDQEGNLTRRKIRSGRCQ